MIRFADHLTSETVLDLTSHTRDAALMELVEALGRSSEVSDKEKLLGALLERERIVSTGIGAGVAVPHAKIPAVSDFVVAYGRSVGGIDWGAVDDRPVHHVVVIAGPPDRQHRYLQFLASVTLKLKSTDLRDALQEAADAADLLRVLAAT